MLRGKLIMNMFICGKERAMIPNTTPAARSETITGAASFTPRTNNPDIAVIRKWIRPPLICHAPTGISV